jgi:hypothetical protein
MDLFITTILTVNVNISNYFIEWNNMSDLTPFLQENKGVIIWVGTGWDGWSSASGLNNAFNQHTTAYRHISATTL